jgi:FlgD Ig-like domain
MDVATNTNSGEPLAQTVARPAEPRPRSRSLLPLLLASALAVGGLTVTPPRAYAAVVPVTTPLPQGRTLPSSAIAFGSAIVWDTLRSSDSGSTWVADATLAQRVRWDFAGGGNMARVVTGTTNDTAVVYTPSSGAVVNSTIPSGYTSINASYAAYPSSVVQLSNGATTPISKPTGITPAPTILDQQLSTSNALVWLGTTNGGTTPNVVAAAPTPTSPSSWVSIPSYEDGSLSDTDFLYVTTTTTTLRICKRSLASFTSTPSCTPVASGDYSTGYTASVRSLGTLNLVHVWNVAAGVDRAYIASVVSPSTWQVSPVQLPTGSTVFDAFRGGSPYLILQDANSVPSVSTVAADGSLTPSFAIPTTTTAAPQLLAVTPDRVVGADSRDGSMVLPVWSRKVSAAGFLGETSLPPRATGLTASAGRTAVMGPAGVTVYDRGVLQRAFGDQGVVTDVNLSGPYVAELLVDPVSHDISTKVSKADGTGASTMADWPVDLFGSQYVTAWRDSLDSGSLHIVVQDLTGATGTSTYTLPASTAACYPSNVWGSTVALVCSGSSRVYDYRTNAPLGMTTGTAEALGDGYALVHTASDDVVWNLAANTTTSLGCSGTQPIQTDGVGHIVCSTSTNLVWQDYSSLSTSAPRLLGVLATPTAAFSEPGSTWSLAMDTTKALAAGSVVIKNGLTATVRTLPVAASPDGSVRVTWDGLDDNGKPVRPSTYTYTLTAAGADGSGAPVTVTGSGPASGTVTVTAGSTLGMTAGGFNTLAPYRLLDTRVTGPALGSNQTRSLKVTGVGGVPTTGVAAVVLNVTVTDTTTNGYLTVSPTGNPRPVVSNLNWTAGVTIPNAVTVKVGTGGSIDLFQSGGTGTAQVIVDVAGYYIAGTPTATPTANGAFTSLSPNRILDTRTNGGPIRAYGTRDLQISTTTSGGVPTGAGAVVLNVPVTHTTSNGYLTVYPTGTGAPTASNLNWTPGLTIPNLVTVKLSASGSVTIYQSGPGTADVIVDVAGYYNGGTATLPGTFYPLAPARVLDTRTSSPVGPGGETSLNAAAGVGGIPKTGVAALVLNTTVTDTRAAGFLTVYPGLMGMPLASNLNWSWAGTTIPNLVTVALGVDGTVKFRNGSGGTIQVVADTAGYYISY